MSNTDRFIKELVNEHGQVHYKITDTLRNVTVSCDTNELTSTINEMMEE